MIRSDAVGQSLRGTTAPSSDGVPLRRPAVRHNVPQGVEGLLEPRWAVNRSPRNGHCELLRPSVTAVVTFPPTPDQVNNGRYHVEGRGARSPPPTLGMSLSIPDKHPTHADAQNVEGRGMAAKPELPYNKMFLKIETWTEPDFGSATWDIVANHDELWTLAQDGPESDIARVITDRLHRSALDIVLKGRGGEQDEWRPGGRPLDLTHNPNDEACADDE